VLFLKNIRPQDWCAREAPADLPRPDLSAAAAANTWAVSAGLRSVSFRK
jgi:hypothetical protein